MADDSDVPPLEDMSELLQQVEALKEYKNTKENKSSRQGNSSTAGTVLQGKQTEKLESKTSRAAESNTNNNPKSSSASAFGGMKKGFLFGGAPSGKKPKQAAKSEGHVTDDVPLIKPQQAKEKQFEIPEVQQAMNAGQAFLKNKEWITDDVLNQVQNNEVISKGLTDPRFMQAIAEFQTNPAGAMQKYKDNKEIMAFLQAFCGVMGDHFNKLADEQQSSTSRGRVQSQEAIQVHDSGGAADLRVRSSTDPKQATAADEARMQQILADPDTRDILLDPRVQTLIETLRTDPDKAQRALQVADVDFRRKIQKLVEVGLLQFQT